MMLQPSNPRDRIMVALDAGPQEAVRLAGLLRGRVRWVKVGMTLFYQAGPDIVASLRDLGFDVFLDLKVHDIPHQARGAARSIASLGVGMLTVHASGGAEMVAAAVEGARDGAASAGAETPAVVAVTVLTSLADRQLAEMGIARTAVDQVAALAKMSADAGADGVVCSPLESESVRSALGPRALIVTPGVRPATSDAGDQSRVATPSDAIAAGATYLVIGRPITGAQDPAVALDSIVSEMEG